MDSLVTVAPETFEAPVSVERRAARVEAALESLAHTKRLADGMAPDPKEWAYEGEVSDAGFAGATCTCGHPIRYVFTIRRARDGKTLPIGSVCIGSTVPALIECGAERLAGQLSAALEAHRKVLEDGKRAVRDAAASVEVQALMGELAALKAWAVAEKVRGAYLPRPMWELAVGRTKRVRAATTPGRTAASLRTRLAPLYMATAKHEQNRARRTAPQPKDAKLVAKISKA